MLSDSCRSPCLKALFSLRHLTIFHLSGVVMVLWKTYQSAGPDQSRRALHLQAHTAGSSCLQTLSLGLSGVWFLGTHTVKWIISLVLQGHRFMEENQRDKCLQEGLRQKNHKGYSPDWLLTFGGKKHLNAAGLK